MKRCPFNGDGHLYTGLQWDHVRILDEIKTSYPQIKKIDDAAYSTSYNYQIPGHKGTVGIIAAYSRTFCGTCNRIRITPQGELKTCLYDDGGLNLKELMRAGASDAELTAALLNAFGKRAIDGWEAEKLRVYTRVSMNQWRLLEGNKLKI